MRTRTVPFPLRKAVVVLYGIALLVAGACATFIFNGFRYWSDGSTPKYSLVDDVVFYGLFLGIPTAISVFIVWSSFRRKRGLAYRIFYWILYAALGLASVLCLLSGGKNGAYYFGIPSSVFLFAWFPFRHDRIFDSTSAVSQSGRL
jgi:hypothetical protein